MSSTHPDPIPLKPTAQRVLGFVTPHRRGLFAAIGAYVLAACTEPLIPQLLKVALDDGFSKEAPFPLWWVPVVLIGLFALRGVFSFLGQYLLHWTIGRTVVDLRRALLDALLRADAKVYTQMSGGAAVTKVVGDPQQSIQLLGTACITVLRDGLPALAMLGYLLYINWKLTLLTLVTLPVMSWVLKKVNRRVRQTGTRAYDAQIHLSGVVDDIARAWKLVRSFNAAAFERERFAQAAAAVRLNALKQTAANALAQPLSQMVASVGISVIVSMALYQGRETGATPGEFVEFVGGLLLLMSRARHLAEVAQPITNGLIVARGCMDLLDTPAEADPGSTVLERARGDLDLQDLQLTYPGANHPALNGLSLRIQAGQTVALVGPSGAGKSSVIHLLQGFAEPQGGRFLVDGVDAASLTRASLRSQFAVVSQDIVLFDDTVLANVAYAQTPDPARAEAALRDAALWDFVQTLPQGLHTRIGNNGSTLSGGQRQRLAIARALYRDAPIWIFDEATSALDTESERAVQEALARQQGRKTLILIAHRLSTVRHADAIHVLQAGRVVESGTHADLMALGGAYAALVSLGDEA
ncbi:MAG: ABC transporter transmembrane domain-containing protein [Inhella sp.]|jgi:subfamily B ATP-binding cassette protein MsbA|uniref:ABC transporter transmembrane domain-containing protein n=1 Tax=Inhella sp. TaxID=1921806 RepID=UPI0022BE3B3C|nr:ABC transporter transmembrane domain-containing protein [Inhella sp.]MCZ8233559.1 ABC transporter transmembrane domain-containing protein [Inhella sp.]